MKARVKQLVKLCDAALVELYCSRNPESAYAFEALMENHQSAAVRILHRYFRDPEDVNDYLQAAWLKVLEWLSAGKYKEQGKFKAWFVNIVYGVAFDALRKREKLPVNKAAIEELEQLAGIDIDRKINKFETDQYFAENLNKVPEEFRDAVVLSVKEEMSAEEIAQCLKIKVGTACSRTNRGLNYLQKFYTAPKRAAMGRIYRKRKKITGSGIDRASAAFIVIERHEMENS